MRSTTSTRSTRKRIAYSTLGLAVVVVATFAFSSIYHKTSSSSAGIARTVKVTRGTVQSSVSASGNLSAVATANENFVTGGTLTTVHASVGEKVSAGQVLATIDSLQQNATLQAAQSSLAVAKLTLTSAQKTGATLQRSLVNARSNLAADQSGGTAVQKYQNQSSLDTAQQQLTNDQTQLTSDQALLATDESNLATAQSTLSSDEALGCPAAAASSGSSGPSTGPVTASANSAPSVGTDTATNIATTSAVLNATVNPNGAITTYYFQYGTSTAFGLTTSSSSISAGSASSQVSAVVTGLSPGTTYLFRVVATNKTGTTEGEGVTVTTPSTSCSADSQTVSTDQSKISSDQVQISKDQSAITVQGLSVQIAQSNLAASPSVILSDRSTITQDQSSIAQNKVSIVQDHESIAQDQVALYQDEKSLQDTQLVALISGTVTAVNGTVGETVGGGGSSTTSGSSTSVTTGSSSALVTIQGLGSLQVVASFAEADAIKIAVHQTATISISSLTNTEVKGVVTAVAPTSTVTNNVVTYPVTIALIEPPALLKDGMTAQVSVIVQTASNVLLLPSAAITTTGNLSTVKVLVKGVQKVTAVTLGLVGSSYTQISSGVSEGETVVEPTATVSAATSSGSTFGGGGFGGGGGFAGGAP